MFRKLATVAIRANECECYSLCHRRRRRHRGRGRGRRSLCVRCFISRFSFFKQLTISSVWLLLLYFYALNESIHKHETMSIVSNLYRKYWIHQSGIRMRKMTKETEKTKRNLALYTNYTIFYSMKNEIMGISYRIITTIKYTFAW